jgi:hypothetical protein
MLARQPSVKTVAPAPAAAPTTAPAATAPAATAPAPASPKKSARTLTRRETKRKPSRPSKELLQHIKTLRDRLSDEFKENKDVEEKISTLNAICHDLKTMIDDDESHRSEFSVEITTLEEQDNIRQQLEKIEKEYDDQFVVYQQKVDGLRNKIKALHDKIEEAQGQTLIDNIRKMVTYQQLHNEIQEKINKINYSIERQGCFAKLFCCTSSEISKMQDELDQLEHERTLLSSNDPAAVGKIVATAIEAERSAAEEELATLIKDQPKKVNDLLIKQLAESEAAVEMNRSQYYHAISQAVMYLFVRLYALLERLQRYFKHTKGNQNTASIKVVGDGRKKLQGELSEFYSTNYDENQTPVTFDEYYNQFQTMPDKDQRDIVYGKASKAQKAKLFGDQDAPATPKLK